MISVAYAADTAQSPGMLNMVPLLLMLGVLYVLVFMPQRKRMKAHQTLIAALKHGDSVITASGIYGEITGLTEKVVTLKIADDVRIKVSRPQIAGLASEN